MAWRNHKPLLSILGASLVLRLVLMIRGGLHYYPDEYRYDRAINLLHTLFHEGFRESLVQLFRHPDHCGYTLLSCVPALFQGLFDAFGFPPESTFWFGALWNSLFSIGCIALVYSIALKANAETGEALLAALLMATGITLIRYSVHLLPYDMALFFALLALRLSQREGVKFLRSFGIGLLIAMIFMIYNAFWMLAGVIGLLHIFLQTDSWTTRIKRGIPLAVGGLCLPIGLQVLSRLIGYNFFRGLRRFSGTIDQGAFSEGWSLPLAYLWHSEHFVFLLWIGGVVLAVITPVRRRVGWWLAAAGSLYLLLILGSNVLEHFVVYGRLCRQFIPFVCLAAAAGLWPILNRPRALSLFVTVLVIQWVINAWPVLIQQYPAPLLAKFERTYPMELSVALTVEGPELHVAPSLYGPSRIVLINHRALAGITGAKGTPTGKELFRTRHPLEYKPDQYNGASPEARVLLREGDHSIRLVEISP